VTYFSWKFTLYGTVLKSMACVALVHKAADDIIIAIFPQIFWRKKIDELVLRN
jgi:hypothetical protein